MLTSEFLAEFYSLMLGLFAKQQMKREVDSSDTLISAVMSC